jgi:hypothetical protein
LTVAAARALQGQLAGTCHPKAPTALIRITPTATGCELAEIPIGRKDEVAESASEEIARQVSEQLIPDVPSPQETHPSGSAQAALAEVRSAAGSAAKAREIAVAARDEAKSRISAALSKASDATFDAFGFGTDNELAEKVREKLLEPLIDRFAEAIVAKIGPGTEWRRGRLEATAAVRADRVAAAASADGALSTSELLETVIKAAQKAGADTVYAADRAERMRIERERRQVEEMARRSRGSHIR